jgi:hypothetical protein
MVEGNGTTGCIGARRFAALASIKDNPFLYSGSNPKGQNAARNGFDH